jgi:carboxyl-terminal processing protease
VQTFFRISGETTQKNGVKPDYTLPSTYDYLELGESHLPNALEVKPIERVQGYRSANLAKPYVKDLAAASQARIAGDQDFKYIAEDIELLKKQLEDRRVSLNLEKRLSEKAEQEARKDARLAERAGRASLDEQIFEIDLAGVDAGKPMLTLAALKKIEAEKEAATKEDSEPDADDEESAGEDTSEEGRFDPHLTETLHVLADYARLLQGATLAVNESSTKKVESGGRGTAVVQ